MLKSVYNAATLCAKREKIKRKPINILIVSFAFEINSKIIQTNEKNVVKTQRGKTCTGKMCMWGCVYFCVCRTE